MFQPRFALPILWLLHAAMPLLAQENSPPVTLQVTAHLAPLSAGHRSAPIEAVLWLTPVDHANTPLVQPGMYQMVQKDKEFLPHLLVVPVGSTISFPNADPFFHDVFSYYNGRRFDLGLYEAGSSRSVRFSREGVSYLFCNIHPEMSAVVITMATPYYATADPHGEFFLPAVPAGDYRLHVWTGLAEVAADDAPEQLVHIAPGHATLGIIAGSTATAPPAQHKDKFGQDYPPATPPLY
jgi:plastocyanin